MRDRGWRAVQAASKGQLHAHSNPHSARDRRRARLRTARRQRRSGDHPSPVQQPLQRRPGRAPRPPRLNSAFQSRPAGGRQVKEDRQMSSSVRRVAMLAMVALLSSASIALAGGAKKGATYSGTLAQGKQPITLKVSGRGKTVTASVMVAPLYCEGGSAGERQITKPASIAQNGSFSATIVYEFAPTHTRTTKLYVKGKF